MALSSDRAATAWSVPLALLVLVAVAGFLLPVVPWPRDHWFETQYLIFGSHLESDNYSPISAPAFLYAAIHWLAAEANLDLTGELYLASVVQSAMLFVSSLMIYFGMCELKLPGRATISILSLCLILSTGLPQTFNSENVCLFLTAAVLYASLRICQASPVKNTRFLATTILIGASTGLLVLTRMVPVLFIPGLIWLFSTRIKPKDLLIFGGIITALTVVMLVWLIATNHDRFGRFELTGSTGRHLWQGAKEITDRALRDVPEYQVLKRVDPEVGGSPRRFLPWNTGRDHWNVPYPDEVPGLERFSSAGTSRDRQKDALLQMLALDAIESRPLLYLASGATKFLSTVGGAPYQLGFLYGDGFYNPLSLTEPLPPLANATGLLPRSAPLAFREALDAINRVWEVVYPVTIYLVSVSLLAMGGLSHLAAGRRNSISLDHRQMRPYLIAFGISAIVVAGIACLPRGLTINSSVALGLCIALIVAQLRVLAKLAGQPGAVAGLSFPHQRLYVCLAMLFFGSLWISWQMEVALSRYAIPYLPMLVVMLGIAAGFWRSLAIMTSGSKWSQTHRKDGAKPCE